MNLGRSRGEATESKECGHNNRLELKQEFRAALSTPAMH